MVSKGLPGGESLKENNPDIPVTGMVVLRQQFALVQVLEEWIASIKGKEQADE